MHRLILTAAGLVVLATSGPAAAGGLAEAGELEAARANARAGGPVSERDAELLERWGARAARATRSATSFRTVGITTARIGSARIDS